MDRTRRKSNGTEMMPRANDRISVGPNIEPSSDSSRDERIAQRAYQRFEERGGEHGRDKDDWFEAERELAKRGE